MARVLHKIKNPQEENRLLNENFDRISLDIADRSGTFSNIGSTSVVLPPGEGGSVQINIVDSLNIYGAGRLPTIPQIDIYLDNDLDGNYYWPVGASITPFLRAMINVTPFCALSIVDQIENEKATNFIHIANLDGVDSHTFYVYARTYFVPTPEEGVAARAT